MCEALGVRVGDAEPCRARRGQTCGSATGGKGGREAGKQGGMVYTLRVCGMSMGKEGKKRMWQSDKEGKIRSSWNRIETEIYA